MPAMCLHVKTAVAATLRQAVTHAVVHRATREDIARLVQRFNKLITNSELIWRHSLPAYSFVLQHACNDLVCFLCQMWTNATLDTVTSTVRGDVGTVHPDPTPVYARTSFMASTALQVRICRYTRTIFRSSLQSNYRYMQKDQYLHVFVVRNVSSSYQKFSCIIL